jgi:predicted DNA-binding transcriptional regulator YafY
MVGSISCDAGPREDAMSDESDLTTAIHGKRLIRFRYRDHERIVEPYAFGADDGSFPILRAYQTGGTSGSRDHGWKLFRVDEIKALEVLEETFDTPRTGYMRNDPTMTKIYCEI